MAHEPTAASNPKARAGGRPSRDESQAKQLRILEVAQRVFFAQGYAEATIDTIAHEAGVAKKTLYEHYGDKAGLFAAVMQRLRDAWTRGLHDIVIEATDPRVALEGVALHLLDMGTRSDMLELHRLLLMEARRFPDLIDGRYNKRGAPVGMKPLADYLRRAVKQGSLQLGDIGLATEQFVYLVLGGLRTRILRGVSVRPNATARKRIARQAVTIFLYGCMPQASADTGNSRR